MALASTRLFRISLLALGFAFFGSLLCVRTFAIPPYLATFKSYYHVQEGSQVSKAACMNCHTDPPRHNAYGILVKNALKSANTHILTAAILQGLDKTVLTGHSKPIGEEVRADISPGVVKPVGTAPSIPLHSLHPALVHFPIALFLFGSLLEAIGFYRRAPEIRSAAYWNMFAAVVSSPLTLATGLAAFLRLGFAFSGNALIHIGLALSATAAMTIAVVWRRKETTTALGYWSLLLIANLLLAATGHFGGLVAGLQ